MLDLHATRLLPAGWVDGVHYWVNRIADMRLFNRKSLSTLAFASQLVIGLEVKKGEFDVFQYIDPLIGTANGGEEHQFGGWTFAD
jgi:hypothetical protein